MHYASWRDAYASPLPPEFWGEATERRWISNWIARLQSPQPGSTTWIALSSPYAGTVLTSREEEGILRPGRENKLGRGFYYVPAT
jgi:hypothetical protein